LNNTSVSYQALFISLLEAMPLPVLVVNRSLVIQYYNQSALRLDENIVLARGLKLDQVLRDPSVLQLIRDSVRNGKPLKGRYDKDGTGRGWKVHVTPLEHQEHGLSQEETARAATCAYFAVVIEDMAELLRLERVQRDFLANISHELRTPLTSVRLLAETLEDAIDTDPDKAQMFVEKIEIEVQHLSGLVAEILELSRLESGQMSMTIEPVEAEQLVREVMARMLPLAQRHRVMLGTDIQQGSTLVAADSKQIARVLVNLVHNAIKFTPSGGKIVIGTASQLQQHMQSFFVRDTGIGIREEELSRIFERFYKTDRARSKTDFIGPGGKGAGLGLAIARHVVEAHGGRIMAESKPGQGSTFTFTLPVVTRLDDKGE
jgi:two-component system, OmpR family, phosphate regulon sensor histidine kinase PhoR